MNCHRRSTVAPSPFARKPLAIFTALVSLGLPLTAVCADEEEQPSGATANAAPLEVGSTVVTASGFSQDVRDAPASISVITREELENKQFRSLADAVRNVEGVSIIGGDKGEISIRGMESSHVLILIDGRRQNTSQVTLKGGTSEGLGMNWIPPVEAIDRIEVVRGPMSTLYGSEALGGVINVISKKPKDHWSGSIGVSGGTGLKSDAASQFILHGNVQDLFLLPGTDKVRLGSLAEFLNSALLAPFDVVLAYDIGNGLRVERGGDIFQEWPSAKEKAWPRTPREAVQFLTHYFRFCANLRAAGGRSVSVAGIVRDAQLVAPSGPGGGEAVEVFHLDVQEDDVEAGRVVSD